jgi:preprotein translocase subunit Sec63
MHMLCVCLYVCVFCRIFDHNVNSEIVLFSEKYLLLVVVWLSLSTHL